MTKVKIDPGVCNLLTTVEAKSEDGMTVTLDVKSACPSVQAMIKELGNTFDAYEVCLTKPGGNVFYEYALEHFPGHAACPAISGIVKCIEAECKLALPKNAMITFLNEEKES